MRKTLHICNEPETAELIRKAGIEGLTLPWNENLAIGPVPYQSLEELSDTRINYFRRVCNDQRYYEKSWVKSRNKILRQFPHYDEVVLWFDYDLRDQLQLIQLLNFFAQQTYSVGKLSLICIDRFPGVFGFRSLADLKPKQFQQLIKARKEISDPQLQMAHSAWKAVTAKNPQQLQKILQLSSDALPFLKDAIFRLMQEYPDKRSGLSRSQSQILRAINSGLTQPMKIYYRAMSYEDRPFLNPEEFFLCVDELISEEEGLILTNRQRKLFFQGIPSDRKALRARTLVLSPLGQQVLREKADWLHEGARERWIGGVLISEENVWRRHPEQKSITRTYV